MIMGVSGLRYRISARGICMYLVVRNVGVCMSRETMRAGGCKAEKDREDSGKR